MQKVLMAQGFLAYAKSPLFARVLGAREVIREHIHGQACANHLAQVTRLRDLCTAHGGVLANREAKPHRGAGQGVGDLDHVIHPFVDWSLSEGTDS